MPQGTSGAPPGPRRLHKGPEEEAELDRLPASAGRRGFFPLPLVSAFSDERELGTVRDRCARRQAARDGEEDQRHGVSS